MTNPYESPQSPASRATIGSKIEWSKSASGWFANLLFFLIIPGTVLWAAYRLLSAFQLAQEESIDPTAMANRISDAVILGVMVCFMVVCALALRRWAARPPRRAS